MIFTDPPYNMKIDGHVSGLSAVKHREFAFASGEMTEAEFTAFRERVFANLLLRLSTAPARRPEGCMGATRERGRASR